ncbi:MAG TPA: VOC family protein [Methylomirabilota bacterium]|jgi:catechol 2,3-dioxygenase-like lactoylglutathione lyase family enzyme|nr:VOC family protein [Methylomirabilota bacterium]
MTRTRASAAAVVLALLLGAAVGLGVAAGDDRVHAVGPIGMTVSDADRSTRFYTDVLGFETVSAVTVSGEDHERLLAIPGLRMRVVRLRLGAETIELAQYLTPRGRPIPADSRSNDRWFQHIAIVVSDMDRAYATLRGHGVEHVSPAPQRLPDWNPAAAGIRAFYFKDPDGHALEILQFPAGKGDPRWQRGEGRLFLGIDHTAIVVGDTATSLRCYADTLGLRVAGSSENYGPEQERLNDVVGAHLRITTLRARGGPGIELLEYLAPRDGRPAPTDARANDLAHWQIHLLTADVEAVHRAARGGPCAPRSPDVAGFADGALGFARAAILPDPDGHALVVLQP